MLWWLATLSAIAVLGLTGVVHVVVVGYIVSHCCFRFDRGVVLWWLDILSAIAVLGLTEEWFMLWWLDTLSAIAVLGMTEE